MEQKTEEWKSWKLILGIISIMFLFATMFYISRVEEKNWDMASTKFCANMTALYMGSHGEFITCGVYNAEYGIYDTKDFRVNQTRVRELYG